MNATSLTTLSKPTDSYWRVVRLCDTLEQAMTCCRDMQTTGHDVSVSLINGLSVVERCDLYGSKRSQSTN